MNAAFQHALMVLRRAFPWVLVVVAVAFLVIRSKFSPVPVAEHVVALTTLVAEVMGTGTLEARTKTTISPRLQERLAEVLVDQNDFVKAGQLLARLDDGELQRQVEVAEATLAAAKATADRVRVDEDRAQAVEQQAQREHQRNADLVQTQVSSQADFDKATEQWHIAKSDLQRARAATEEARQQVVMAEKTLAYQQERLGFTRMVSPYDGLITRRDRDPGGVVVPGSSLLQLISTNELWVSAWVDETASSGLAGGQAARVVFRSEPGRVFAGEVVRLGRETDPETREFLVDVRVREWPVNWTTGQRAEVWIETERKDQAVAVPHRFLQWRDGQPGLFVAVQGRAVWRDATLGLFGRTLVEITQGLSAGERVVVPAQPRAAALKAGQRVVVP